MARLSQIIFIGLIIFINIALSSQDEGKCTKPPEGHSHSHQGSCSGEKQKSKYSQKKDSLGLMDFMPSEAFWNNRWYHISPGGNTPDIVKALIEIPKGSRAKFEVDTDSGLLKLDRVLYNSIHYPSHYGYIPSTMTGDRDPLDILVLCSEKVPPMTVIEARVIGIIQMIDGDEEDDKIIAVAKNDPKFSHVQLFNKNNNKFINPINNLFTQKNFIKDINDVSTHTISEIQHFFEDYKRRIGVEVILEEFQGKEQAVEVINQALQYYQSLKAQREKNLLEDQKKSRSH